MDWQKYSYGELLAALRKDLQLDAGTDLLPGSLQSALQGPGAAGGYLFVPARAFRSAALSTTAGAFVMVPVDTLTFDLTGGAMNVTTANGFKAPAAGTYLAVGQANVSATASGQALVAGIHVNGNVTPDVQGAEVWSSAAGGLGSLAVSILHLSAGDVVQLGVFCTVVLALTVGVPRVNFLTVMRVA